MSTMMRLTAAGMCASGLAFAAYACWMSPGMVCHNNDSSCPTERCERFCRICCIHFNPDPLSPGYTACVAACRGLGGNCGEPAGGCGQP